MTELRFKTDLSLRLSINGTTLTCATFVSTVVKRLLGEGLPGRVDWGCVLVLVLVMVLSSFSLARTQICARVCN